MAKAPAKKAAAKKAAAPNIAAGAGVVVVAADPERASRIERAMSDAIAQAVADGVSDPDEQRKRIMAARDEALKG